MKRELIFAACIMFLSIAVSAPADEIKVGGGGAAISSIIRPVSAPFRKATGISVVTMPSTPKDGLVALAKGEVDAATAAVPLESMIAGAKQDGVSIDPGTLQQQVVGTNKTVVVVHAANPVAKLSKEQLKAIFAGTITNWKDVGGKDQDIIVVWGTRSPGQNALFIKGILDGAPVTKDVLETTDYEGIKQAVGANPEAIGIDPLGLAEGPVKPIYTDPEITSPVIIVTKGKPSSSVQKFIDYVKGDGQRSLKR
jgi:phosphate transport system substrate-binding protein